MTSRPKTRGTTSLENLSRAYSPPLRNRRAKNVADPARRNSSGMCHGETKAMKWLSGQLNSPFLA